MSQIEKVLKSVIERFYEFAKSVIEKKKQDLSVSKDPKGNIHLHPFDLELFYNKQKDSLKPLIPYKDLEELAKLFEPNYEFLEVRDIYFALPHIFYNIFNFIFWDKKNINVEYKISNDTWSGVHSFYNFTPKSLKPKSFEDLYKNPSLQFSKEVIKATLSDINKKYDNQHFQFELKLNSTFINQPNESINIDNRLEVSILNEVLTIKGQYSGNPNRATRCLQNDIFGILSILEMEEILRIKDTEKRIGGSLFRGNTCEDKEIILTYEKFNKGENNDFDILLHTFKEHLKKFNESGIGNIPIYFFMLLSKKFDGDILRIIPNFFSSENFRFSRTEFFNYWSALEILLGNPEKDIKNSLVKAYELFYPEENNKDDSQKTISKLWKIRNDIVHNGKIDVDSSLIWDMKNEVKSLFYKILLTRMADKFYFSIKLSEEAR